MTSRPKVAVRIPECIGEWAEIETMMGMCLAFLLDTDPKAALAIYAAVDNRAAQLRILQGTAHAKLPMDHADVLTVLLQAFVRPAMKERDKFAHWCWGYALELPEALLLMPPDEKMKVHIGALQPPKPPQFDWDKVFVITEDDLVRLLKRLRAAKDYLARFMGSIWQSNTPDQRAAALHSLSNEPRIREALTRLFEARQKNQTAQSRSPPPESTF